MDETVYIPFLILSLESAGSHLQHLPVWTNHVSNAHWPRVATAAVWTAGCFSSMSWEKPMWPHSLGMSSGSPRPSVRYWLFLLDSRLDSPPALPGHSVDPWTPSFDLPHLLPGPLTDAELRLPRTNEGRAHLWPLPGQLHLTELSMMIESPTSVMSTIGA